MQFRNHMYAVLFKNFMYKLHIFVYVKYYVINIFVFNVILCECSEKKNVSKTFIFTINMNANKNMALRSISDMRQDLHNAKRLDL